MPTADIIVDARDGLKHRYRLTLEAGHVTRIENLIKPFPDPRHRPRGTYTRLLWTAGEPMTAAVQRVLRAWAHWPSNTETMATIRWLKLARRRSRETT